MESDEIVPAPVNLEIFTLVWLDVPTHPSDDHAEMQRQLRTIVNYLRRFDDIDLCEQYIRSLSKDDRLVLLTHTQFAEDLTSRVHELRRITSIYVHAVDEEVTHEWTKGYAKVRCLRKDLQDVLACIKADDNKRKKLQVPLKINTFDPKQSTNRLPLNTNTHFLHAQLVVHFLLNTKLTDEQIVENKKELIERCRTQYHDNVTQLKILHEFEHNYLASNALWWYNLHSFLYQLLNKALNSSNIDILDCLQVFIHDLLRQLKQYRSSSTRRVYRTYLISADELDLLEESVGKYICINTFLSTYTSREHALEYFVDYEPDNDAVRKILLKIDVDPRAMKHKPLGNITVHSRTAQTEELLFALGSIFRVVSIHQDENHLSTVHLSLCDDDDPVFKPVFDYVKRQCDSNTMDLLSFGNALRRMGKVDEAKQCYERLLRDKTSDSNTISRAYHHLGRIEETKGDYDAGLEWLHKSLQVKLTIMKPNDPSIAQSYNCIGIAYQQKGDHDKALEAFGKALAIWKRAYGKNHPSVAGCLNNMGVVYKREKKYSEALQSFELALEIRARHPSANPHDLAGSHNNIGAVYERLGHHSLAIEHYNLSLKIKSKALPAQHPSIASTLENMGYVHENRRAYNQALSYLERAAMIYRQSLPATQPEVTQIEASIRRVTEKLS